MEVGIEAMGVYAGATSVEVKDVFLRRGLNLQRLENLMMRQKSVAAPWEDPVTNAVNAALPVVSRLSEEEKARIEFVITATESGVDFGKSLSTYVHAQLGLNHHCRLLEVKQACYGATAGLMLAAGYVGAHSHSSPKALVIATDVARSAEEVGYAEPSQGSGAVALLVSDRPKLLELDFGASGLFGYEVMDTCRPGYDLETGDPDLSLYSYLDCLERCFEAYGSRVDGVDVVNTFEALAFHTPFAGMVKGAHRRLLRRFGALDPAAVERDFATRVAPSLEYPMRVGNLYSASLYLALAGLVDNWRGSTPSRVGLFSYGSGCSSEFFSGLIAAQAKQQLCGGGIREQLDDRWPLDMDEYDSMLAAFRAVRFGVKDFEIALSPFGHIYERAFAGRRRLVLKQIRNYHREYAWS